MQCLQQTKTHPTADWIYDQLRPTNPNLSLATVYRNLYQLKEAGLIRSMGVLAGQEHFDGNVTPHAHVMCTSCGRIDDLMLTPALHAALADAQNTNGFHITAQQFVGLCPECQQKKPIN